MSIVSCPRCGDKVSLPPVASPSELVQCPLCLEEYFLSDALIQLPPMLVVVGSRGEAAEKVGEYRLAEPVAAAVSEAQFEPDPATVAARPQLKTVSRRRPQERSAIGEIVKVVLGGVAGLAGGLLVLWWGFGVDVGDLGPQVSKVQYLRFLVPPKLRAQTEPPGTEPPALDTMNADARQGKGDDGQAGANGDLGPGAEDGATANGDVESRAASNEKAQGKRAKGKGKKGKKQPEDDPFAEVDLPGGKSAAGESLEPKIDDPLSAIKPKQEDNKPKEKDPPPPTAPKSSPEGAGGGNFGGGGRPPTQAELARRLAQAIEGVSGSIDALETVNRDDTAAVEAALKYVYDMAARLTTSVLEMDSTSPEFDEQRQSLNDCLRRLARDSRRTDTIRQRARIKLDDTATNGSWILLAGTVKDAGPAGEWFQTMVEATDDERFVAVLTADDPNDSWKVGDQVIVLGRVVHDPVANAKGYEGDAEVAVTSAHGVTTGGASANVEDAKTEDKGKKAESNPGRSEQPATEKPKPAEPKADEPKSDKPKSDEDKPAEKDAE